MITKELVDYVSKQLSSGITREQITLSLLSGGSWTKQDIDEVFNTMNKQSNIPAPTELNQKKSNKTLIVSIVIVIVLVVCGIITYFIFNKSLTTTAVAENKKVTLPEVTNTVAQAEPKIVYTRVPDVENNASDLNSIDTKIITKTDQAFLSKYFYKFSATNTPPIAEAKQVSSRYSNILSTFDSAVTKKYYQCSIDFEDCDYSILRTVASVALLKAFILNSEGKKSEAIKYAENVVVLGKQITANADELLELLLGWPIQKNGYSMLTKIGGFTLSAENKNNSISILRLEHKIVFHFMEARHLEIVDYITSKDNKPTLINLDLDSGDYIQTYRKSINSVTWNPEETKKLLSDSYQTAIANMDVSCGEKLNISRIDLYFNPEDKSSPENQKNLVGKTLYSTMYPSSFDSMNLKRCEVESLIKSF